MAMMSTDMSITVQNVDSDYGTWSSSSSDRCFELQNITSDFETSFSYQANNFSSTCCSCCNETPIDINTFNETPLKNAYEQTSYQSFPRKRTDRWRGIRMGITIDYNAIKTHADRYRKKQRITKDMPDDNKFSRIYDEPTPVVNRSMTKSYANYRHYSGECDESSQNLNFTIVSNENSLDYSPDIMTTAISPTNALNSSHNVPTTARRNSQSVRSIPQEIINNAKIITCKVAIVGARKSGKSTLAKRQFLNEVFFGESEDETEPIFKRQNDRSNEGISSRFMIDILDDDNDEQNILRADAIVLVYSVTDKKSFTEVTNYYRSVMSARKHMFPLILVGAKADVDKKKRKVSPFEGQSLARRFNCPFIEVSAKTNDRVHEAFVELMRLVDKQHARFRRFKRSLAPILL